MDHSSLGMNIKKLGFGYMRLPQKDGEFDIALLNQMADKYLAAGFSYFDTSPVYGMGQSESVFRQTVVERHPRESFQIATKLPMWTIDRPEGMQEKFDNSLKNLGVDYVDFYLLHGLSGVVSDRFTSSGIDKANKMGAWEFLKKCKAEGKGDAARRYVNITKTSPKASECVKCKKCENSCPQHLPITELLERVAKTFEGH